MSSKASRTEKRRMLRAMLNTAKRRTDAAFDAYLTAEAHRWGKEGNNEIFHVAEDRLDAAFRAEDAILDAAMAAHEAERRRREDEAEEIAHHALTGE